MRKCTLFFLALFGIALCSLVSKDGEESAIKSGVPLIANNMNTQVLTQNRDSIKTCPYLKDITDYHTEETTALTGKEISRKSLHLEKVKRWMKNGKHELRRFLFFDVENAYLELGFRFELTKLFYNSSILEVLHAVMQGMIKLNLSRFSSLILTNDSKQFPDVEELIVTVGSSIYDNLNARRIRLAFPNIKILQLDLYVGQYQKMPSMINAVFSEIPMLQKLVIRIISLCDKISSRDDLLAKLELILQDERVELKFEEPKILSDQAVIWASEIFNSELKKESKRVFFCVGYNEQLRNIDSLQVHSLFYRTEQNDSLRSVLSNIEMFTQLKQLNLELTNSIESFDLTVSGPKPLASLVGFFIKCDDPQCHMLFSLWHNVFPNLTVLIIHSSSLLDSWFESLFQFENLDKLALQMTKTTMEGLIYLLTAVSNGAFPKLKDFSMPKLDNVDCFSAELEAVCKKLPADRPLIKFRNAPSFCQHFFN